MTQGRKHDLSDWLTLHGLDGPTCRVILDSMKCETEDEAASIWEPGQRHEMIDLEAAWARTAQAMRRFLPGQKDLIDDTFAKTEKVRIAPRGDSRKAATIDNGPERYPTIVYSYRGDAADFLVLAHEFGHALQIRASRGQFVPPILREACAFLGEGALLAHSEQEGAAEYPALDERWRRDNRKFFGSQKDRLKAALTKPQTPYVYSWNYPIARQLAVRLRETNSRDEIWRLFEGKVAAQDILHELAASASDLGIAASPNAPST